MFQITNLWELLIEGSRQKNYFYLAVYEPNKKAVAWLHLDCGKTHLLKATGSGLLEIGLCWKQALQLLE